jgi:hypothetical protein
MTKFYILFWICRAMFCNKELYVNVQLCFNQKLIFSIQTFNSCLIVVIEIQENVIVTLIMRTQIQNTLI